MNDQQQAEMNKAVVTRFNKAFIESGDMQAFNEIMDPSFVNHTAMPGMPSGPEGMVQTITLFRKAFPGLRVEIYDQVAEGDRVVTRKAFFATHGGPFMGIETTGRPVRIDTIDIIRLRNGKYLEHWAVRDMLAVMQQLKSSS